MGWRRMEAVALLETNVGLASATGLVVKEATSVDLCV
jgi:hypothetical protein